MVEYLFKASTQEGYYIEIMMMLLSGTFNARFRATIQEHGISFYESNTSMMINVTVDGFDRFHVDPSQVGRLLILDSSKKTHQLSNNKKRDNATLMITTDNPDELILQISDSAKVTSMDVIYNIEVCEEDQQAYVVQDLRHINPTVIIESGEMTKAIKIVTKASSGNIEIHAQKRGIQLIPVNTTGGTVADRPISIGMWKSNSPVLNTHTISKQSLRSILKFYNLAKKLRIHSMETCYCMSMYIPSGLGFATIVFTSVNDN
jgi:hypothetical protein